MNPHAYTCFLEPKPLAHTTQMFYPKQNPSHNSLLFTIFFTPLLKSLWKKFLFGLRMEGHIFSFLCDGKSPSSSFSLMSLKHPDSIICVHRGQDRLWRHQEVSDFPTLLAPTQHLMTCGAHHSSQTFSGSTFLDSWFLTSSWNKVASCSPFSK